MKIITQTPVIDTSIYAAGDCVGPAMTFDLGYVGSKKHQLRRVSILEDAATPQSAELNLHLFQLSSLADADQAALALTAAQFTSGAYIGAINLKDWVATEIGTQANAVIAEQDVAWAVKPIRGKIYGQLTCVGTPTFAAAGDLTVALHFE